MPPPDRGLNKQMFFQLFGAYVSIESGHWNVDENFCDIGNFKKDKDEECVDGTVDLLDVLRVLVGESVEPGGWNIPRWHIENL